MIDFGLEPGDFRDTVFEKQPHHFRDALQERPFAWPDVDRLLHVLEPSVPLMRMFHHGQVPEHAYTDEIAEPGRTGRVLNKARFYEHMGRGATLVINWLEQHSVAAKRLCLEVGRYVGTRTSSNAYMSFAGDGTFGQHWDTHDVFVIQLIGRKRWRIFPPTFPLPLTYQTNDKSGQSCPTEPAAEFILEEGDVMYVPRGWWHHVIPLKVGSFHLSVGSYSPTTFDFVMQTSARYLEQEIGARKAFSSADYRERVADLVSKLGSVLLDPARAEAFERDWIGRERMTAEFNVAALDLAATPLSGASVLRLATFRVPAFERGELVVNGLKLQLEPVCQAIVAVLGDTTEMSFKALCASLDSYSADALKTAVLDLTRHDIVSIQSVESSSQQTAR